ncbi:ultraviolet-B receptor UVR8 isoform X2 [Ischnura elegans]|uniref:ultraviolet-B receptor UVR8 isoform X2 n=1 Tax=Ischnura elegans TaxID=197161 RepID=UPI001ED8BD99|nr:ultraviolet-B receptor UVR8 isoform X2 [Ischnura elegans]
MTVENHSKQQTETVHIENFPMKVYYCGFNGFGQFPGKDKSKFSLLSPKLVPFDVGFLSCAWNRICFSTGSEAYLSGLIDGESGKLVNLSIPSPRAISQVSCSRNNILAITEDGDCWMRQFTEDWKNISDLLRAEIDSHDTLIGTDNPEVSSTDHKIIKVCSGENVNLAVCNFGQVYSIPSPLSIPGKKVVEVACGFDHCLALTVDGIVYSWGSGRRGQLGHDVLEDEDSPRELEMLSGLQVKSISAGGWHSVALMRSGDAYVWGWNSSGQLGLPCNEPRERITEDGGVDMPSSDDKGIPSLSKCISPEITSIKALPVPINFPQGDEGKLITAASCGSRHTIILTEHAREC